MLTLAYDGDGTFIFVTIQSTELWAVTIAPILNINQYVQKKQNIMGTMKQYDR